MELACLDRARKPAGGFAFVTVAHLCAAWTAYREKEIELNDLRTWFAAWELRSRRCLLGRKRIARYEFAELAALTGASSAERSRESVRRLEKAGLISWSGDCVDFPLTDLSESGQQMIAKIVNNRRKVPIPRRMLRFLAKNAGRVVIATLLGHLLRCLYYRNGECRASGMCKATWIAEVFRVDPRNVKAARRELASLGILSLSDTCQWKLNRFGMSATVNLSWESVKPSSLRAIRLPTMPPPAHHFDPSLPPPDSNQELLSKYRNQKPAPSGSSGSHARKVSKPVMANILVEDLRSLQRLRELFREARGQKLVADGEASWLSFVAAAEHALAAGKTNPPGLFRAIICRGLWRFITQQDEDSARQRLSIANSRRVARAAVVERGSPTGQRIAPLADTVQQLLAKLQFRAQL